MVEIRLSVVIIFILLVIVVIRVLIRPHREPASRIAWLVVVVSLPVAGVILYLFFGEVNLGRARIARLKKYLNDMPPITTTLSAGFNKHVPPRFRKIFRVGESVCGFLPLGGNSSLLMQDSNTTIDAIVHDIDTAKEHVHLLFYIWLSDNNGRKVINAVKRAAQRGVTCRVMVDSLGSRKLVSSHHWSDMQNAGVKVAESLKIGNPFIRPLIGRIDLRNHRKIVVIDNQITYCGSQNCADPEFLVKAKYAPWVDVVIRIEGPIAMQQQFLFAVDWMTATNENISDLVSRSSTDSSQGEFAQVIGTGPTTRFSAMPEIFEALISTADDEVIATTPYFIPDESLQRALCSAAYRGTNVRLIVPARNDSLIVGYASRSYYETLLTAGVKIYEYNGGLLHAKTLTIDGEATLIGSANMDRRSFELNFENNIVIYDPALTENIRARQLHFQTQSTEITEDHIKCWSLPQQLIHNFFAMLAPLL